jgi:hypothetical protein
MRKMLAFMTVLCLLLSGCSYWMNGSYSSVEPHKEPINQTVKPAVPVSSYEQIVAALESWLETGGEDGVLALQYEEQSMAQADVEKAISVLSKTNPFAAYGVETIEYSLGASGGQNVAAIQINYLPSRVRADKIQRVQSSVEAQQIIAACLDNCDASLVLYLQNPEQADYDQMVSDYALANPQKVIEVPDVTVSLYPQEGQKQIVEIKFSYQTSRAQLRTLQNRVAPVFTSASQYVTGDWTAIQKAQRLYDFLMDRYDYNIQTSITPSYSLLLHGVGDSRAFAVVYGAMCRQAGLDGYVVTGTRDGAPWVWNAVQIDGEYYYIDLLRCNEKDGFQLYTQAEMTSYVWDYSAYPVAE